MDGRMNGWSKGQPQNMREGLVRGAQGGPPTSVPPPGPPPTMVTLPSQPSKPEGWTSTSLLPSPCDMRSATKPCASYHFLGPDSHQPFPGLLKVLLLVGLPALAFLSLLTSHPSQSHSAESQNGLTSSTGSCNSDQRRACDGSVMQLG